MSSLLHHFPPLNSESLSDALNSLPSNSLFRVSSFLTFHLFFPFLRVSSSFFGVPYHLSLNSLHNLSSRGPVEHERRPAKTLGTEDDIRKQLSKFFQLTAAITYRHTSLLTNYVTNSTLNSTPHLHSITYTSQIPLLLRDRKQQENNKKT